MNVSLKKVTTFPERTFVERTCVANPQYLSDGPYSLRENEQAEMSFNQI